MTYLCPSCNYPAISAADHCDNPACLENPAITTAQSERIKADTAKLTIFRLTWSHAKGVYWMPMRATHPDDAESWLRVFRLDEPNAVYIAAAKAPKIKPGDKKRALHPATF